MKRVSMVGMLFNVTFNNISNILRRSVLLVEYSKEPTDLHSITDKHYHIKFHRIHLAISGIQTHNFSVDRL
jgi:hypothetical protein